jgi:RNA polymerase sigma factor (sigma-70 family)
MANKQLGVVVQTLRRVLARDPNQRTDAELVEHFVANGDQAAFEALVRRHGPMVLGVCRRIVQHTQDAEDAFQATFLILARKAATLARRELLSGWLYGVAFRVARRSRTMRARRKLRERPFHDHHGKEDGNGVYSDLEPLLDEELHRLPKAYQLPILLCDLQGKSRRDAAEQIGVPEGTLSSRLARGRELLRQRLTRRGVTLGAGALLAALTRDASAALPSTLVSSTAQAASLYAVGPLTTGLVSTKVLTLAEGGLKSLLLVKLQIAGALLLAVGVVGGLLTLRTPDAAPQTATPGRSAVAPAVQPPAPPKAAPLVAAARLVAVDDDPDDIGADDIDKPPDPDLDDPPEPPGTVTPPHISESPSVPRVNPSRRCPSNRTGFWNRK